MTDTHTEAAAAASDLLRASGTALRALAGAVDDLRRATLILNQMATGTSQRIRGPEDYWRIAGQFADRARACKTADDILATALRRVQVAAQADAASAALAMHPPHRAGKQS